MWQNLETSKEFFAGHYRLALKKAQEGRNLPAATQIACSIFLGQISDAEPVFKTAPLEGEMLAVAQFFLALGYVRTSRYDEAIRLFALNARAFRHSGEGVARFFAFQGIAFYRFYCGRYHRSRAYAERALALASMLDFPYGQAIALDAFANVALNSGHARLGLAAFKEASSLAESLGGAFAKAVEISLVKNRATFAQTPLQAIAALRKAAKTVLENTYSTAEIRLELIRQLVCAGRMTEAKQLLNETNDLVHKMRIEGKRRH